MKIPKSANIPAGTTGVGVNLAAMGLDTSQAERLEGGPTGQEAKYGNQPVMIDGWRFASKQEGERYRLLKSLERADVIVDLEIHPRYSLDVNGVHIANYTADFRYRIIAGERSGEVVVEDVKSEPTRQKESFRLKRKLMRAVHGIDVQVICKE
jgi:hypothetical protein